jgi:ribosomal protein S18 acetylase RimI-like enzyme
MDSERFGVRVVRIPRLRGPEIHADLARCTELRADLLIARCPGDDMATVLDAQRAGFLLMDCLVHYERALTDLPRRFCPTGVAIRSSAPEDADAVARIARRCFTGYRGHYHADPRLDRRAATEVYVSWARTAVVDPAPGTEVLVGAVEGRVVAFLVLERSGDRARASLAGVLPEHRDRRVLEALSVERLHRSAERGAKTAVSSYLLSNVAVQRSAARSGFRIARSEYTFHRWSDES